MTTKIIVPCITVGAKTLRHRWGRYEKVGSRWQRRCIQCRRLEDDVHAAWT